MSSDRQWIFYDSMSKTQSNSITSDEAQMAIFKMKPKDWKRFFIWTNEWKSWQPLELFLKSDQDFFITDFKAHDSIEDTVKYEKVRTVLEMNSVSKRKHKEITKSFSGVLIEDRHPVDKPVTHEVYDVDELSWSKTKKPEINFKKLKEKMSYGMRERRHEFKIEVLLITVKGNIFRSTSKNISLSGSLLEDNIPFDYYGVIFDIVIVNRGSEVSPTARLVLKAKTVGDGLTQRLNFHDISESQKAALHTLLQEYLDQQKKSA